MCAENLRKAALFLMPSKTSDISYDYLSEAPLDDKISYNYAPNHGAAFLDAWRHQRQTLARQLPSPIKHRITHALPLPELETHVQTEKLLDALLAHIIHESEPSSLSQKWLKILVGKFETTGRLHEEYSAQFLAVDKIRCRNINLYITFCEILVAVQKGVPNLLYFNTLLKGLDVLCSLHTNFNPDASGRTAYLIAMEAEISQKLYSALSRMS